MNGTFFLIKIYYRILSLDFKSQDICFDSELTKIQKYKLKKNNPNLPDILISKSPGKEIDIPYARMISVRGFPN